MDVFSGLNEQQCEAVRATEGFVRVIAGAGSGKTRLLVNRYAYLVDDYGINPSNILCVTFTNKAAAEMRRRINSFLGEGYDTSLICTYHGFCARLLREDADKLFLTKDFQIIDESAQRSMLEEIYQKYELKLDFASFGSILKKIARFKSDISYVASMCNPKKCRIYTTNKLVDANKLVDDNSVDDNIIEDFLQRQKATYSLDFTDLMSFALYLLNRNDELREKWQDRLNYIQVDEFQDSSKREMQLIDILCGKYRNLLIVGDPDQNIYEWRGSDVKLLVDFDKCHESTETIFLNRNYRSTPQILKCANTLIDKNELRLKKDLFTFTPPGSDVVHIHAKSDSLEAEAITQEIERLKRDNSYKNSDFAILYRSGFLSRVIEKRLVETGIAYEIYGGVRFYQRMEVLDLIAYLRVIAYGDDTSLKRIINTPRRRFGRAKLNALSELADDIIPLGAPENPNLYELLKLHLNDSIFATSRAAEFVAFVEDIRARRAGMRISELVRTVTTDSGYEQYIRELGDEERLENLAEFKRMADEFEKNYGEELSLEDFLNQLAMQSGEGSEDSRDTVKLMTIHAAKGLEFPVVFVTGFSEGIFPSSKTIEERRRPGLEEERRLCYVALTRAQKQLYLTDSEGASQNGNKKLPSRFLEDIGRENYIRIGEISEDLLNESRRYSERHNGNDVEVPRLAIGEQVTHHIFGEGTIIGIDERRRSYTVLFAKSGQTRNLSEDYFKRQHEKASDNRQTVVDNCENQKPEPESTDDKTAVEYEVPTISEEITSDSPAAENDYMGTQADDNSAESIVIEDSIETELNTVEQITNAADESLVSELNDGTFDETFDESEEVPASLEQTTENLWNRPDVPHSGWICTGITDLGSPSGICQMCGHQIIRYVHHMIHPQYRSLGVGCVCAGKMEGDVEAARKRERDFKNRAARLENFRRRTWKNSKKGNPYLRVNNRVIVLYYSKQHQCWSYAIDNSFSQSKYKTREETIDAVFAALNDNKN